MRARAVPLLVAIALAVAAGAAPGAGRSSAPRVSAGGGVSVRLPTGWHVITRQLTDVVSPTQRLVVTSFPIPPRPPVDGCDPLAAIRRLPATGAFLFMWEYSGPTRLRRRQLIQFPVRPRRFPVAERDFVSYGGAASGPRMTTILFRQAGRAFQAQLYLGAAAPAPTIRRLAAVLDSVGVTGPAPPVPLPRR